MKKILISLICFVFLVGLSGEVFGAAITSCETVTEDSVLEADLRTNGTCLIIGANDITLDCDGYSITGDKSGFDHGIHLYWWSNVTIKNCNINNFETGIYLQSSSDNTLINNTVDSNLNFGIYLVYSSFNTLKNNNASNNRYGIGDFSSNDNLLIDNTVNSNIRGIEISNNNNNSLVNNNVSNNGKSIPFPEGQGIRIRSSTNNTIINNTGNSNFEWGLWLESSSSTIIANNSFSSNSISGIFLKDSSNNTVTGNNASYNNYGIYVTASDYNVIDSNIVNYNNLTSYEATGIRLIYYSDFNKVSNNNASYNIYGIYFLDSNNNTIFKNYVNSNSYGIYLDASFNNTIFHNNVMNNTLQAEDTHPGITNSWHNQTLLQGNYWSDYDGSDDGSGTGKHDFSGDHIGDTNLPWPSVGYDNYPYVYDNGWLRPGIVIYEDTHNYTNGDEMNVSLNITNPGDEINVGVGIWLDLPSGAKYWIVRKQDVTLPEGFEYGNPSFLSFTLLSISPGDYAWHAVLYDSVKAEIISESIEPWTFSSTAAKSNRMKAFERKLGKGSKKIDFEE